jgi:hypothetical protein
LLGWRSFRLNFAVLCDKEINEHRGLPDMNVKRRRGERSNKGRLELGFPLQLLFHRSIHVHLASGTPFCNCVPLIDVFTTPQIFTS